jgi:hypothetical protein
MVIGIACWTQSPADTMTKESPYSYKGYRHKSDHAGKESRKLAPEDQLTLEERFLDPSSLHSQEGPHKKSRGPEGSIMLDYSHSHFLTLTIVTISS